MAVVNGWKLLLSQLRKIQLMTVEILKGNSYYSRLVYI